MNITIPAAALEAGAQLIANKIDWSGEDLNDEECDTYRGIARAACLAMLKNWPGMERERIGKGYEWPLTEEYTDTIILPLPEASDDMV